MPVVDPRLGDVEDDRSSTKQRSILAIAGNLLVEISLPKLVVAWLLLIGLPGLVLGALPLIVSLWIASVSAKVSAVPSGIWPALLLPPLAAAAWFGGRPLYQLAETSFWSLNALVVQPGYALCRETSRHMVENMFASNASKARLAFLRASLAAGSGLVLGAIGLLIVVHAWPSTRWTADFGDLAAPHRLLPPIIANFTVIVASYFAVAGVTWGIADALMPQPGDLNSFHTAQSGDRKWRVAHVSDLHVVGERYGFRIESGRAGARGNGRLRGVLARLEAIHAEAALDAIVITGDLTDAGRSAEWAELLDMLAMHPALSELIIALPGNHDVNVIDRANPARLELPGGWKQRLRQLRTLSALEVLQGSRVRVFDRTAGRVGACLSDALEPYAGAMRAFSNRGASALPRKLNTLWSDVFPMVRPPASAEGLGIIVLNSNAETHFSFTNALGIISVEQARAVEAVVRQYPEACWIVALHHHLVEYPKPAKELSERIGTALINGAWFVRMLQRFAGHAVVMHGHRHIDWIGECGELLIVSAPSPVMEATDGIETYFYVHTLAADHHRRLRLLEPERIAVPGSETAEGSTAAPPALV